MFSYFKKAPEMEHRAKESEMVRRSEVSREKPYRNMLSIERVEGGNSGVLHC